jgi:hypothetical protein
MGTKGMETISHGTPILQARRSRANAEEYETLVISAGTYIVRPTTMSRKDMISFLNAQIFAYLSREEFLRELERKGSTTAQVKVPRKVNVD